MELCDVCGQALRGQCTTVNGTVIMHNYLLLLLLNVCRSQASCALLCLQQVWGPNQRQFLWRQTHWKVSVHRLSPGYYSKSRYLSILSASMINVGKQREMFRVSESNCGTLSHSQREQTASRMLQVCLLACSWQYQLVPPPGAAGVALVWGEGTWSRLVNLFVETVLGPCKSTINTHHLQF